VVIERAGLLFERDETGRAEDGGVGGDHRLGEAVAGLHRKCYVLSQDGSTVGGIYLWNSRAEAEAMYTERWKNFVREKYHAEPSLTYFDTPVVVDNVSHEIISDE